MFVLSIKTIKNEKVYRQFKFIASCITLIYTEILIGDTSGKTHVMLMMATDQLMGYINPFWIR